MLRFKISTIYGSVLQRMASKGSFIFWLQNGKLRGLSRVPAFATRRQFHVSPLAASMRKEPCKECDCEGKTNPVLMDIKGKVAIVTGGTGGIGHAAAYKFLKAGGKAVVVAGQNEERGKQTVKKLQDKFGAEKACFKPGSVTDPEHWKELFEHAISKHKGVDVLFNNAGMLVDKEWEKTFDVNVKGVFRGCLEAFKYMGKDRCGNGGVIVNNASILGLGPLPSIPAYSASKYAVVGITANLGHQFHMKTTGVRVVALCPGVTDTILISGAAPLQLRDDWGKHAAEALGALPAQKPSATGKAFVHLVQHAPNGSMWVIEDSTLLRAHIPPRQSYSKPVAKYE